jgi:putative restriction endonuclease
MRFWVAVTDNDWFKFLSRLQPDEVNFWQPSGNRAFGAIEPGAPFLFKLHSPHNYIVGGGFFVRHSFLPLSIAWEAFGEKNGASTFEAFLDLVLKHRSGESRPDPQIGCIVLVEPFFFPREAWIPVPKGWSPNIVQGKTYDTDEAVGAALWDQVRIGMMQGLASRRKEAAIAVAEEAPRYGADFLTRARLGQGAFRVLVTDAYERRCAVSGERTLPVLEAAHIRPYAESGPHRVSNGVLVRADFHILLDRGYMTLTEDLRVEVSRRIKEDFDNGEQYYALHGEALRVVPRRPSERPSVDFIRWHNENRFLGG